MRQEADSSKTDPLLPRNEPVQIDGHDAPQVGADQDESHNPAAARDSFRFNKQLFLRLWRLFGLMTLVEEPDEADDEPKGAAKAKSQSWVVTIDEPSAWRRGVAARWISRHYRELGRLLCLLAAIVLNQGLIYFVGLLPSQLYGALMNRSSAQFFSILWWAVAYTLCEAAAVALLDYWEQRVALRWRRRLSRALHHAAVRRRRPYSLAQGLLEGLDTPPMDNVDQRMTIDTQKSAELLATIFAKLGALPLNLCLYTAKLGATTGWIGVLSVYLYFSVASVLNRALMAKVAAAVWLRDRAEGDFRFSHARLRDQSEAVCMLDGCG
eukprot:Selendium_serpulae@DN2224_c0_g1_i1.p1